MNNRIDIKEMFMKLNMRQKKLILMLILVLVAVITFKISFGFFDIKAKNLYSENKALMLHIEEHKNLINKEESIMDEIRLLNDESKTIIDSYSAGNSPEKTLVFLEELGNVSGMSIPSVNFGSEILISAGADIAKTESMKNRENNFKTEEQSDQVNIEGEDSDLYLYNYPVTFSYIVPYDGIKVALSYIEKYPEKISIESFSAAYDASTGYISGSITLNQYMLTGEGTDKIYQPPQIDGGGTGITDLFG